MSAPGTQETVSAAARESAYRGAADDIRSRRVRLSMTHGGMIPRGARFLRMVISRSPEISAEFSREGYDDTSKSICIDRWQLVGRGANCFADELFKSAEQTLHALAHCCARNSHIERGARCQATPRRRTACHDPATSRRIFPPRCACAMASLMEERG